MRRVFPFNAAPMKRRLFGTDGVRGTANIYPITAEMALSLGRAIAYTYQGQQGHHRILVGKDTRLSGYMIEYALTAGICSMGADVLLVGPMPTPAIAFLTHSMRADAGVVISASHNPFQDNGIKFFDSQGFKLGDDIELKIEKLIFMNGIDSMRPTAEAIGKATRIDDASGRYIQYLKKTFPDELSLDGLKVVLDCANGAGYVIAPIVLEELGAEVIPVNVEPDGSNINEKSGAVEPQLLADLVTQHQADIGIALDGDADRTLLVDEQGHVVPGDAVLAVLALKLKQEGHLAKDTMVATQTSSIALDRCLESAGIRVERCQVGDRYVVETMRKQGLNLGGEQSGHIVCFDHSTTGDGMVAALQILAAIAKAQRPLSELTKSYKPYPQAFRNVRVKQKTEISKVDELSNTIKKIEHELGDKGRLLVRYSGTEPLLRVMVEGPNQKVAESYAQDIANAVQKNLG